VQHHQLGAHILMLKLVMHHSGSERWKILWDKHPQPGQGDKQLAGELLAAIGNEHASVDEALTDRHWCQAMIDELDSIKKNNTWSLTDLPKGHKQIGLKWVFKLKYDEHGEIVKYKAQLVARGFVQKQGIYFEEVFTHVARMESVKVKPRRTQRAL
jgi:hypothetical protein